MNEQRPASGGRRGNRAHNGVLPSAWKTFAEHYTVHGDWVTAFKEAYPNSKDWKSESLHGAISRMRRRPEVMRHIHELRLPVMQKLALDYQWVLEETVRQYYAASLEDDRKNALAALRQIGRLLGLDFSETARLHGQQPAPEVEPAMNDAEFGELKRRVRQAFAKEDRAAERAGTGGGSEPLDAPFRRLAERASAGNAPRPTDGNQ